MSILANDVFRTCKSLHMNLITTYKIKSRERKENLHNIDLTKTPIKILPLQNYKINCLPNHCERL